MKLRDASIHFMCWAVGFAAISVGVTSLHVNTTIAKVDQTVAALQPAVQKLPVMVNEANELLVRSKDMMTDLHKTIYTGQKLEDQEIAAVGAFNLKVGTALDSTNALLVATKDNENQITQHTNAALSATTADVQQLHAVMAQAQVNLATLDTTEKALTALVSNPDIPASLKDVHSILDSGKQIAADGQHVVHSYVYPKPIVSIVNWTLKGVEAAGSWLHF